MREALHQQDQSIKNDLTMMFERGKMEEREKQKAVVEEIKKLREELARAADQKYEIDWEKLSRTAHWTNNSINLSTINNTRRRLIGGGENSIKLKTTFNTD